MFQKRRSVFLGIGLALILVLIIGGIVLYSRFAGGEQIELARLNGGIAFISDREGKWDIFTLSVDGMLNNLTAEGDGHDYFPSYAFDGQMINLLTNRSGIEIGPAQVRPDGSDFKVLDIISAIISVAQDQRFQWDPAYSVDGWQLWAEIANLNLDLFVQPPEGEKIRLTRDSINGPRDWFASWSPDGKTIIYSSDRTGTEEIYLIPREGGTPQQLTNTAYDVFHGAFSLDGQTILFVSNEDEIMMTGELRLFLMDADGSNIRPIGDEIFKGDGQHSPNGTQIIYMSNETGTWHIYVMDADGNNVQQLTETGNNLFAVWETIPVSALPEATNTP